MTDQNDLIEAALGEVIPFGDTPTPQAEQLGQDVMQLLAERREVEHAPNALEPFSTLELLDELRRRVVLGVIFKGDGP